MDILNFILGAIAVVSFLAALSAAFFAQSGKSTRELLRENNTALQETNVRLEKENREYKQKVTDLEGRILILESLKTPSLDNLTALNTKNHEELRKSIKDLAKAVHELSGVKS